MAGGSTFRLEPPRLRTIADPREDRHATWFELYFDLVFVAAVSQLAAALARDPSGIVFARFAALFVVVGWAWAGFTFYANRFDTDDLIFRLARSGAMFAIAALAVNVHRVMEDDGGAVGFAAAYVVVRSLLVALYVRARLHVRGDGRKLIDVYIAHFSFTTGLWLVSIFVPGPFRYVLWGVALAIDFATPPRAWRALAGVPAFVVSHLTDRYGTFFIIVLGESVVAVVAGVAGFEFSSASWVVAGTCFVIALCLWWIYFDLADTSVLGRGLMGLIYVYGHFPLLAGVAAFGAGTKLAITQADHAGLDAGVRWAFAGGISIRIGSCAASHRRGMDLTARPHIPRPDLARGAGDHVGGGRRRHRPGGVRRTRDGRRPRPAAPRGVHGTDRSGKHLGAGGARGRCRWLIPERGARRDCLEVAGPPI